MVKFHEERYWQKVMSLFCVYSAYSCEANKSWNSKPIFAYGRSWTVNRSHQKKNWKRYILGCVFYCLKLRFVAHKGASARQNVHARVYGSCARVRAWIFTKNNLVVTSYLMSLSFKFHKDPSFRWGDIPLFVTMYDLELKILSFSKPQKNSILCGKICPLEIVKLIILLDIMHWTPFIW